MSISDNYKLKFKDDAIFCKPDIPAKKLNKAMKSYAPSVQADDVLLLVDDTVFGSAKEGLIITADRIYAKEMMEKPVSFPFASLNDISVDKKKMLINGESFTELATISKEKIKLLGELIAELSNRDISSTQNSSKTKISEQVDASPIHSAQNESESDLAKNELEDEESTSPSSHPSDDNTQLNKNKLQEKELGRVETPQTPLIPDELKPANAEKNNFGEAKSISSNLAKEEEKSEDQKDFTEIIKRINSIDELGLEANVKKTALWFILSFASLLLSLEFLFVGLNTFNGRSPLNDFGFTVTDGLGFFSFIFVVCVCYTLYSLFNSKNAAAKAYEINFIIPEKYKNNMEKGLYELVVSAAKKTNLSKVPAVGIYNSEEINAFATGPNRDDSIVAFSSGLLDSMSEGEIGAVACHEIAHIANGDMVRMSVIESTVKAFSLIIQIPLTVITFFMSLRDEHGRRNYFLIICSLVIQWVVFRICSFLGNLLMNFFSRQREFSADKMSAQILGKEQMINALRSLEKTMSIPLPQLTEEQAALSTLKICSVNSFLELFSTHPRIEKRIERLNEISL